MKYLKKISIKYIHFIYTHKCVEYIIIKKEVKKIFVVLISGY